MKTCVLQLRLKTHWLGARWSASNGDTGVFRFDRSQSGALAVNAKHWMWAAAEAAEHCGFGKKWTNSLRMPSEIPMPSIKRFVRKYKVGKNAKEYKAVHEAFSPNTILTLPVYLFDTAEHSGDPGATEEDVKKVFSVIGDIIGLSPWGNAYGYGRFSVL